MTHRAFVFASVLLLVVLAVFAVAVAVLPRANMPSVETRSASPFDATGHDAGPDGPILIVTSPDSTFGRYYAEILRTEGLNEFLVVDISTVTPQFLKDYDVVILAGIPISATQAGLLEDWVESGGNLIAMDPDPHLAGLLGIAPRKGRVSNGYLSVDSTTAIGAGVVGDTMQFHGTAHLNSLNGASSLATLYATVTAPAPYPAVTLRSVGARGGQAASFAFDLATSIVYTRQGNPAWSGQERDSLGPVRSNDLFFGSSTLDPQPDWIDLSKVSIPQADEQQRFLANLILHMNLDRKPLPRFWYFPNGHRAVVIMTGDSHVSSNNSLASSITAERFDRFIALSPPGCSLADWECVRGTSYVLVSSPLTNTQAASYEDLGFEVSLHVSTDCRDYTPDSLASAYSRQIAEWSHRFPHNLAPSTQRHHCIVWSDWITGAKVGLYHGIRLDTNYYYWPASWVNDKPGHFTGSAMPMRFADLDGTLVDVYQVVTQMTDESGQKYPYTVDTLLDRALGREEQYGAYTVNAHTDTGPQHAFVADSVVASAQRRGVPVVSARQMLTWLDGRNASAFGAIAWNGSALSFTISPGEGAHGLQAMIPQSAGAGAVITIRRDGDSVPFEIVTVKGVTYARFAALGGSYIATYGGDR